MNDAIASAIAAAVGSIDTTPQTHAFKYGMSGALAISSTDGAIVVPFTAKSFDLDNAVSGGVFTAPVNGIYQISCGVWFEYVSGGSTGLDLVVELEQVGVGTIKFQANESGDDTRGRSQVVSASVQLAAGAQVRCKFSVSSDAGVTNWNIQPNEASSFSGQLVQAT